MYIAYQNNCKIVEKVEFKSIEEERFERLNEFRKLFIEFNKNIDIDKIEIINTINLEKHLCLDKEKIYENELCYFIYKYNNIIEVYQLDIESKHIIEITKRCDINHIIKNNELKWKEEENNNVCTIM